jgi:hypothetical protein
MRASDDGASFVLSMPPSIFSVHERCRAYARAAMPMLRGTRDHSA